MVSLLYIVARKFLILTKCYNQTMKTVQTFKSYIRLLRQVYHSVLSTAVLYTGVTPPSAHSHYCPTLILLLQLVAFFVQRTNLLKRSHFTWKEKWHYTWHSFLTAILIPWLLVLTVGLFVIWGFFVAGVSFSGFHQNGHWRQRISIHFYCIAQAKRHWLPLKHVIYFITLRNLKWVSTLFY